MYDDFKDITGFDVRTLFTEFVEFVSNQSQKILDYYSGKLSSLDRESYEEFLRLQSKTTELLGILELNLERFLTVNYWEIATFADEINVKLLTIDNFSKFTRSSIKRGSFTSDIVLEVPLQTNSTIEELVDGVGSIDRENDWVDVAVSNNLIQEDYTPEQNVLLNVNFKNSSDSKVTSVVGSTIGDKIKGTDVDKKITFDSEDVVILGLNATAFQSMNVLANLKKNDNPEFYVAGIDKTLVLGMSLKAIAIPSIVRQIHQTFSTDDSVKKIELMNTNFNEDTLNMDLVITLKSGEEQTQTFNIQ